MLAALDPRRASRLARHRMVPNLLDQALSSATNFGGSIVAAHHLSAHSFGIFVLCYAAYLLAVRLVFGLVAEPYVVMMGAESPRRMRREAGASIRSAAVVGLLLGLPAVAIGLLIGGEAGVAAAVLGAGLPVLFTFEVLRWIAFTRRRPWVAVSADGTWCVVLVASVVALAVTGTELGSAGQVLAVWLLGPVLGTAVFFALLGWPLPMRGRWFLAHWRLGVPIAAEFVIARAVVFLSALFVSAGISVAAAGTLEAGRLVFAPLNVLFIGVPAALLPEAVAQRARGEIGRVQRSGRYVALGLAAFTAAYGLVVVAAPDRLGEAVLGDRWADAQTVLWPTSAFMVCTAFLFGSRVRLRAYRAVARSFNVRLVGASLTLGFAVLALSFDADVTGVAWAVALGTLIMAALSEFACVRTPEERALRNSATANGPTVDERSRVEAPAGTTTTA